MKDLEKYFTKNSKEVIEKKRIIYHNHICKKYPIILNNTIILDEINKEMLYLGKKFNLDLSKRKIKKEYVHFFDGLKIEDYKEGRGGIYPSLDIVIKCDFNWVNHLIHESIHNFGYKEIIIEKNNLEFNKIGFREKNDNYKNFNEGFTEYLGLVFEEKLMKKNEILKKYYDETIPFCYSRLVSFCKDIINNSTKIEFDKIIISYFTGSDDWKTILAKKYGKNALNIINNLENSDKSLNFALKEFKLNI